jgi:hypothetical protein
MSERKNGNDAKIFEKHEWMARSMKTVMTATFVLVLAAGHLAAETQNIPVSQLGKDFQLCGKLHVPLGEISSLEGVVVEGPFKGCEGGFNLRVQRIAGKITQEDIQIVIRPAFYEWGEKANAGGTSLPKLKIGDTYEMLGYETGSFTGEPNGVFENGGVVTQTVGFYFREEFVVIKAKHIKSISFTPNAFHQYCERGLVQGVAVTRDGKAVMEGKDWSVAVTNTAWPKDIEGEQIETYGLYDRKYGDTTFQLVDGTWRLVRLEDQLGRKVELHGRARSCNDAWWFHYRGTDVCVENMSSLPGWTRENHWKPVVIRGRLEKATLPNIERWSGSSGDKEMLEYFIVRDAQWSPLPSLLSPERPFAEPE